MARTIAIVEDEKAIRDNYKEAFTRQGYRVDTYSNRADAMAQFRSRLPDLIVLDIALEDDVDAGFEMPWVQVVDQFRWSPHVEIVAPFTRN